MSTDISHEIYTGLVPCMVEMASLSSSMAIQLVLRHLVEVRLEIEYYYLNIHINLSYHKMKDDSSTYIFHPYRQKTVNTLATAAYPTVLLLSLIHGRMWIPSRAMTCFRITSPSIRVDQHYRTVPTKQRHLGIGGHTISPMEKCIQPKCNIFHLSRRDTLN